MKKLFNTFFTMIVVTTFIWTSCEMAEQEDMEVHEENFAVVEGFLTTGSGDDPLVDFPLSVVFAPDGFGSGNEGDIRAEGVTNESGFYQMKFQFTEDELNLYGFFVRMGSLTDSIQGLMFCSNIFNEHITFEPEINDTTNLNQWFIPPYAELVPQVINSDQIAKNDTLLLEARWIINTSGCLSYSLYVFDTQFTQSEILPVVANVPLALKTISIKNGIRTEKFDTLTLKSEESVEYNVVFE